MGGFEKYDVIIMCYQRSRWFLMDQPRTEREKRYGVVMKVVKVEVEGRSKDSGSVD